MKMRRDESSQEKNVESQKTVVVSSIKKTAPCIQLVVKTSKNTLCCTKNKLVK